ncbi:hypothetical protein [Methylorubrum thiocyanatum]|uniref:hypothetical protein n=1 Tax=Methylorubrum thiocyanatum TaxID=47958 RepID=UPI0035C83BB5
MRRNIALIILTLLVMPAAGLAALFWTELEALRALAQGSGTRDNPFIVAIVEDTFDWIAFWTLVITAIAAVISFGGIKFWDWWDRRRTAAEAAQREANRRLSWAANARMVAAEGAGQILYAGLVGFGFDVPTYLGTRPNFVRRWKSWIHYRVDGLRQEQGKLDSERLGEMRLSVARLTLAGRLSWLLEEGGNQVAAGETQADLLAAALEGARDALSSFMMAEENAARDAGQIPDRDDRSAAIYADLTALPYDQLRLWIDGS